MKLHQLRRCLLAVFVLAAAPLVSRAQITRFEIAGIPQVLRATTGGFSSGVRGGENLGYNTTTNRIHWHDDAGAAAGHSLFWLDPTISGDLGASPNALTGSVRHYNTSSTNTFFGGTVTGNVKTSYGGGQHGFAYVPETNSMFNIAGTGNGGAIVEYQPARSVSGSDTVGEGTIGDMTNSAREVSRVSGGVTTGEHKSGLAYLGDNGLNYEFLVINRHDSTSNEGIKIEVSKTFSTAPTATTSGVRSKTVGGEGASAFVTSAELNSLVPGVGDSIRDIANDLSGNIYAVSVDGTHNYLSAFTVDDLGTFIQIDLDPNSTDLHVDLLDLITDNAGTNVAATGLAVNGDASKIYIGASNTDTNPFDNIFIFDQVVGSAAVPEPASIAIWSLIGLSLAGYGCFRARRKI